MAHDSLGGQNVLVTAGAAGIGRAIAAAFLEAGAQVTICDVDSEVLAGCLAELPGLRGYKTDVADPEQVSALFAEVTAHSDRLDVLVNNAAIAGPTGPIEDCDPADWRRTLAVGLDGTFHCLRHAMPMMKQAGSGCVINIASTAGIMGYPLRTPYAAAKWAVVGVTKSLAMEVGPQGIRVNAICPGSVDGPRMDRVIAAEAQARGETVAAVRRGYLNQSSLRTFIDGEDIAAMALFLASDAGAKITGQAISVDGNNETLTTIDPN